MLFSISLTFGLFAQGYKPGDIAADFKLMNIDGTYVSLSGDFPSANGFIVIFTCNHCPFSVVYEDRINALDAKYKKMGYPVIAINPNDPEVQPEDSFENMKVRANEKDFTFPYLIDENQTVYPMYGATRTPHVFVLHREADILRVAYIGAIDNNSQNAEEATEKYVENAVDALLKGYKPAVDFTKAIGCSIKASKGNKE